MSCLPVPVTIPRAALVTGGASASAAPSRSALAEAGFDVAIHCHTSRGGGGDRRRRSGASAAAP